MRQPQRKTRLNRASIRPAAESQDEIARAILHLVGGEHELSFLAQVVARRAANQLD
jgi:hypothetical protein